MWEEVGFYEGFALMWQAIYKQHPSQSDDRALNHIKHLLNLVSQFPRVNPSPSSDDSTSESELDIPKLFRQIRSRYKALCATLGVRPSLRASEVGDAAGDRDEMLSEEAATTGALRPKTASQLLKLDFCFHPSIRRDRCQKGIVYTPILVYGKAPRMTGSNVIHSA